MSFRLGIIFVLTALPLRVAAQERPDKGEDTRPILITGQVVDVETGVPLGGASVSLEGLGLTRIADRQGLFQFLAVRPGHYLLRVEQLGYGTVADTLEVPERGRLELEVGLSPRPIDLEPVVARVEYAGGTHLREFYRRRRTGLGSYLTRADFEAVNAGHVTDAFRMIPGVRVLGTSRGHLVRLRGGCRPSVYLDGLLLADVVMSLDDIVHPNDVEGIEVYRGPETPVAFTQAGGGCGAVVIWTRPGGGGGRLSFWRGALYASVFLLLGAVLTR